MSLQLTYRFGVPGRKPKPKNKDDEQIDGLVEEWLINHVKKYPHVFQLDYEHGTECIKYGCRCTRLSDCVKLEDTTTEGKNNNRREKGLTTREKEIASRLRKLEFNFNDFWENF